MGYVASFLLDVSRICDRLPVAKIEAMAQTLAQLRARGGRLFVIGVGGSAANAGHAVNDFRKLCRIEAYAPTDNVAELTARTNDDGWETVFSRWLEVSRLSATDAILVLSVGGGSMDGKVSACIVHAVGLAAQRGADVLGIVGRADGFVGQHCPDVVIIPEGEAQWVTPMAETFQAVVWHCVANHPALRGT